LDAVINYLDKYTTQIFVLQLGMLVILVGIIIWVYFYNRKKYHNLKHQIPASVVKNYLDSIIQNSTALKSSLFRGGGLDVDPSSVPSVMPLNQLETSTPVDVGTLGEGSTDEALKAEVARLQSQLNEKQATIKDLEEKNVDLSGTVKAKQERIEELEKLLAEAQAASSDEASAGGDEALKAQLDEITKERDQLKDDLAQYDIIEDDLADLKRLKQENEQLKAALESSGGSIPDSAPAPETEAQAPAVEDEASAPAPEAEAPAAEAEAPAAEPEAPAAEAEAPAAEAEAPKDDSKEEDKSPEDLLSEFEKMLG
jgi:myosin heavy subunit